MDIKEHPFKTAGAIAALIGSLVTGVLFIEDRYANAADVANGFVSQQTHFDKTLMDYRKQELEDRIFMIELKKQMGKEDPLDEALKERYKLQLEKME